MKFLEIDIPFCSPFNRDLLIKEPKKYLELKERPDTGVYVKDLQQFVCKSITEIQHVMHVGNQNRAVG